MTLPDGTITTPTPETRSSSLVESLTAHQSATLSAALLEHPTVALAVTVHVMALQVFYSGHSDDTALQIDARPASFREVEGSPAAVFIDAAREHWSERLPGDPEALFAWCLIQDADTLRGLLAFCVAATVNGVRLKSDHPDDDRMTHAALLAATLKLDVTAWITPTAGNYFGNISKAAIIDVLREIKGDVAPAWSGMKKTELAAIAEREVRGTGWLPTLLRAPQTLPHSAT